MRYWMAWAFVEVGRSLVETGIDIAGQGHLCIGFEVRPRPRWWGCLAWPLSLMVGAVALWVYMVVAFSI